MPLDTFAADLELYGPQAPPPKDLTLKRSRRYCRRLARRHYENFAVASWLLPRRLRQHFYNVYAYCRWADDLADRADSPQRGLALLDWWEQHLQECYRGHAVHPVFIALAETIERFQLPCEPFAELLVAFRQDQRISRYESFEKLLNYCRYSANPVGRLVLRLGRCYDERLGQLADLVSTGLQLANFWQDVARDFERGRIYLPLTHCRRFGFDESQFARRKATEPFRRLLAAEVAEAQGWLHRGLPLVDLVSPELKLDVALFIHGGLGILDAIRKCDYDVWSQRPALRKTDKLGILLACWWQIRRGKPFTAEVAAESPLPPGED
jgi:squalene synthase HpnC